MVRDEAEAILGSTGWLADRSPAFRNEVLSRSVLQRFSAGDIIYRIADPPGGIYGLVKGSLAVNCAPPEREPQMIQMGLAGIWTGEGSYLSRQPRRVELQIKAESWLMHLPLDQMDKMAYRDPSVVRDFSMILLNTADILVRIVHDLQKRDPARRIAATIHRATFGCGGELLLGQSELGEMSCASRRQVGTALKHFANQGWISTGYSVVTVLDTDALYHYAHME